jgi:hypothetical protein
MKRSILAALACAACLAPAIAEGHGFVGDRFFPPTITTDDPFAVDELDFYPEEFVNPGTPEVRDTDVGVEFDKEIFPHFALGISDDYDWLKPRGQKTTAGWDDVAVDAMQELWHNDEHEAIISVGLVAAVGGTGAESIGADPGTVFTPTFYFGKGFGDLPDSVWALQPFAITGTLGEDFPTRADQDDNAFETGLAIEYSLLYLQQDVKDVGFSEPFKNMIPLVEMTFTTEENRVNHGQTTGSINPGVLWETRYTQLGVEALVPINKSSGNHVGVIFDVDIFIDDIFPSVFGHPLFGGTP